VTFFIHIHPVGVPDATVTFRGDDQFGKGLVVVPDGFRGWNGGAPKRRDVKLRQNRRGARRARAYGNPRTVTIEAWANASSLAALSDISDLIGVLDSDDVELVKISVEEMGRTLWQIGSVDFAGFDPDGTDPTADVNLELWIEDSVKYGEIHYDPSDGPGRSSSVTHAGNTTAALVHTVTGESATGYTLASDGKRFQVLEPLVPGRPHVVDMETGELSINGVVIDDKVGDADLWGCPGGRAVITTVNGGSAQVQTRVIDTYS
jgi:hypothetical protein